MASVFKAKPSDERYTIMYYDENKTRRKKMGYASKKDTERLAMKLEDEAKKIRDGLADPKERGYQVHEKTPLADHLEAYGKYLVNKGAGDKHSQSTVQQARDAITLIGAKRISDLSFSKVAEAINQIREDGRGTETANHYIRSIKAFSRWLWKDNRARDHVLVHLETKSSESDRKHVRRALEPDEAAKVIDAAERGPAYRGLAGPDRAMLYSVALGTGFRAEELRSLTPERFDLAPTRPQRHAWPVTPRTARMLCNRWPNRWLIGFAPGWPCNALEGPCSSR